MKPRRIHRTAVWLMPVMALFLVISVSGINSEDMGKRLLDNFKVFSPPEPLLPPGVTPQDAFEAGAGAPVGVVQKVQGAVYAIHKGGAVAYRLAADSPLFAEDTLITTARSRVYALMNDQSTLALNSETKLTIAKSEYDAKAQKRSTVMGLLWGSARFIVKALKGQDDPNYEVRTPTAVCGVRGTDFAVSVSMAEKKSASTGFTKYLGKLSLVSEAHAFLPGLLITTVVTGPGSTLGLTGGIGGMQIIGPFSVAGAIGGGAAGGGIFVGAGAAGGVLGSVGPGLATLAMPPGME